MTAIIIKSAAHAEQGPRERQEDATLYDPASRVFGVFDGLGGYRDGDKNSALAAAYLLECWSKDGEPRTPGGLARAWDAACARLDSELPHGDTTATVGVVMGGGRCLLVLHAGDSGVTRISGQDVKRLTERHGEGHWVHRTMRGGHTRRRPIPSLRDKPDTHTVPLVAGDVLIFHTDGLDPILSDTAALVELCAERDPERLARALCIEALTRGGDDNVSCVVLIIEADPTAALASISREGLEAAGRWAGLGVDGGWVG